MLDYRFANGGRMIAVYQRDNSDTFWSHSTQEPSNDNDAWTRTITYSQGEGVNADTWFGEVLRFQTVGNTDQYGRDFFRIWHNRVPVDACNQAGGIGGCGDNCSWYNELSVPSDYGGCQENDIRGTIGTNGGGNLRLEEE